MVVATATAPGAATGTLASLTSGVAGLGVADPPATPPRPRGYDDEPGAVGNVLSTKVALALSPSEDPPPRSGFPYVIPLKELCLESVARAFASDQSCLREGVLPESLRARVVDLLDVRLDINLAGRWIADEAYWCRRARARWPSLARPGFAPTARGRSWKQMYFEKHVEEAIVASANDEAGHGPGPGDEDETLDDEKKRNEKENHLDATVRLAKKWTRVLSLRGLRAGGGSVRLGPTLFEPLAGCLTSLTLQYGAKGAGVGYEPSAFGMAEADCEALARCLPSAETLVRLSLPENGLDCRRARIIAAGLGDNVSVTVLDLRSNAIGCRGARAIAKLLDARSVLRELDLGDNDVGEEGARALARALRKNISMRTLSLRLNAFVGDAGGEALCDAIRKASVAGTTRLESIDLGACGLGRARRARRRACYDAKTPCSSRRHSPGTTISGPRRAGRSARRSAVSSRKPTPATGRTRRRRIPTRFVRHPAQARVRRRRRTTDPSRNLSGRPRNSRRSPRCVRWRFAGAGSGRSARRRWRRRCARTARGVRRAPWSSRIASPGSSRTRRSSRTCGKRVTSST